MNEIIGISGKIGSGKDTVAKLLQMHAWNKKEILAPKVFKYDKDYLISHNLDLLDIYPSFSTMRFATKLKQFVADILNIDPVLLDNQDFKMSKLPVEWNKVRNNIDALNIKVPMTVREMLIAIGDGMRNCVHPDIWVNALFSQYRPGEYVGTTQVGDRMPSWIIPDMRYPNEKERIEKLEGITIRVERPGIKKLDHISETVLDSAQFDWTIINDKDISILFDQTKMIYDDIHSRFSK